MTRKSDHKEAKYEKHGTWLHSPADFVVVCWQMQMKCSERRANIFNWWSYPHLRWPPQLSNLVKYKNVYNSVNFTDIELKSAVIIAESHSQDILWTLRLHITSFTRFVQNGYNTRWFLSENVAWKALMHSIKECHVFNFRVTTSACSLTQQRSKKRLEQWAGCRSVRSHSASSRHNVLFSLWLLAHECHTPVCLSRRETGFNSRSGMLTW